MKYDRFEDLPVWKGAIELVDRVYSFTRDRAFVQPGDLRDQLRRAALSISNNIAEGFELGTTNELLKFLYIARGSSGEVRSMLHVCDRLPELQNLKSQISNLKSLAESCSRQLRGWADSLQNSDIKGQRHLNEAARISYERKRSSDAFMKQMEATAQENLARWLEKIGSSKNENAGTNEPGNAAQQE